MSSPGHSHPCRCSACSPDHGHRPPLMTMAGVGFYRGERTILSDVDFTLDRGDFVAITGPNGGGKTTLLRLVLGLLAPTRGSITFFDESGKEASRPSIGYLPQKSTVDSHFPITISEVVASALLPLKIPASERDRRVEDAVELVGLSDLLRRPIGKLSGGQLQRALFARAIVARPDVLALDEPQSYIDRHFEKRLYDILAEIAPSTTILLVSHQTNGLDRLADRHIIVSGGNLTECTAHHHGLPPTECC